MKNLAKTFMIMATVMAIVICMVPTAAEAKSKGLVITATYKDEDRTIKKTLTKNNSCVGLTMGSKATIVVKYNGKNVTSKAKFTFKNSDSLKKSKTGEMTPMFVGKNIAKINKKGKITPKNVGDAIVKVTYKNKTKTFSVSSEKSLAQQAKCKHEWEKDWYDAGNGIFFCGGKICMKCGRESSLAK